ncbi:hypothetical protein M405DRAFT_815721, partial [Rhizopogon salebrosus TDB-379]
MQMYQVHSHFHTLKHAVTSVLLQSETTGPDTSSTAGAAHHHQTHAHRVNQPNTRGAPQVA